MSEATIAVGTAEVQKTESPKAPAKPRPQPKGSKKATTAKASKSNPKAPAKKEAKGSRGPTVRHRVFSLLSKNPNGLTGPKIMEKLDLSGIPSFLKDEGMCAKPRIRRLDIEGVRGVVYQLTAQGKKDLETGKVDENAAESAAGKEWPNGR